MVTDPTAPATKQDIALLMDTMGNLLIATEEWKSGMLHDMEVWKDELKRHFDVVAEKLSHDLCGALRDHTSVNANRFTAHDRRITRLERHTGLVSR